MRERPWLPVDRCGGYLRAVAYGFGDSVSFGARLGAALIRRPRLLATAARQARALAPDRWWTRPPHLPLPPEDYLRFRQVTSTGSSQDLPAVDEVITWLEWCRALRVLPRGH